VVAIAPCWRMALFGIHPSGCQKGDEKDRSGHPKGSTPKSSAILGTIAIGLIAAMVSFLPTAYFNWKESRDWTGAIIEDQPFKTSQVWARMLGNLEMTAALNLEPPVAPFAKTWNERVAPKLTPRKLQGKIQANIQHVSRHALGIDEM